MNCVILKLYIETVVNANFLYFITNSLKQVAIAIKPIIRNDNFYRSDIQRILRITFMVTVKFNHINIYYEINGGLECPLRAQMD